MWLRAKELKISNAFVMWLRDDGRSSQKGPSKGAVPPLTRDQISLRKMADMNATVLDFNRSVNHFDWPSVLKFGDLTPKLSALIEPSLSSPVGVMRLAIV